MFKRAGMTDAQRHTLRQKKRLDRLEIRARKKALRGGGATVSYSKIILAVIVLTLFLTIFYAMYEMHRQQDLSALYALLTGVSATALSAIVSYLWKSAKENTAGGITYERVLNGQERDGCCEEAPFTGQTKDKETIGEESI